MDGLLLINKEKGFTSFDVVAKLRGILHQKKIGHTGTLDPDATGVLPVCLGKATRLCGMLTDHDKEYRTVFRLGVETDTQDMSGRILQECEVSCTPEEVRHCAESFLGSYEQIPPMYSAKKVGGKKLYELARAGREVERQAQQVEIFRLEILRIDLPEVEMLVGCSKGTYIRTLCHDIGRKLGCGAAVAELCRTRVGQFRLEDSHTLEEIRVMQENGSLAAEVRSLEELLPDMPVYVCGADYEKPLLNGAALLPDWLGLSLLPAENVLVKSSSGGIAGIYMPETETGQLKPLKMLLAGCEPSDG